MFMYRVSGLGLRENVYPFAHRDAVPSLHVASVCSDAFLQKSACRKHLLET